jgi:uncharacterized membrane protein
MKSPSILETWFQHQKPNRSNEENYWLCTSDDTGCLKVALGFMIVSNIHTSIGYFFHEWIWVKIKWGKIGYKKQDNTLCVTVSC